MRGTSYTFRLISDRDIKVVSRVSFFDFALSCNGFDISLTMPPIIMSTEGLLLICFIFCLQLQLCHGFAISRTSTNHNNNKLLMAMMIDDGDDDGNQHEEKRRRQMILATLSALMVDPLPVLSVNEFCLVPLVLLPNCLLLLLDF